jgi:hypothetical protein
MAVISEVISFEEKLRERNIKDIESRLEQSSKSLKDLMRAHVLARNVAAENGTSSPSGPK